MDSPDGGPPTSLSSGTYGESFADVYDDWYGTVTDADATARFVADRCGSGPVLELGVGTGRLARPMLALGLDVIGLDASPAMLAGCVDEQRGEPVPVVLADMAALPFNGPFGAVLIAFNTLFNLADADAQQSLFRQLSPLLAADGSLVVEVMNTSDLAAGPKRSLALNRRHLDGITVAATVLDPDRQTILGRHVDIRNDGIRHRPWLLRWSTEVEIDTFAERAGLVPAERHRGWNPTSSEDNDTRIIVYRPGTPV